jgi:hypothetical protein
MRRYAAGSGIPLELSPAGATIRLSAALAVAALQRPARAAFNAERIHQRAG